MVAADCAAAAATVEGSEVEGGAEVGTAGVEEEEKDDAEAGMPKGGYTDVEDAVDEDDAVAGVAEALEAAAATVEAAEASSCLLCETLVFVRSPTAAL